MRKRGKGEEEDDDDDEKRKRKESGGKKQDKLASRKLGRSWRQGRGQ